MKQEKQANIESQLEKIEDVCREYNKNRSFLTQLVTTFICAGLLYLQHQVMIGCIPLELSKVCMQYIGVCLLLTPLFGWIGYFVEFYTKSFKLFKIVKGTIWMVELILVIVFLILLKFAK